MRTSEATAARASTLALMTVLAAVSTSAAFAEERIVTYQPKSGPLLWPSGPVTVKRRQQCYV